MVALYAVTDASDALAADLNQYRNLFRGGMVYDVLNGHGAAGDGTTDDATAIQTVIDLAGTNGGGIVYFPEATYAIGTKLTLADGVRLLGAGAGSIIAPSTTINAIYGNNLMYAGVANLKIDHGLITSGGAADADSILFEGTSEGCVVMDCIVTGTARDGIAFRGTSSRGNAAIGNTIYGSNEDGIIVNGSHHRIIGNYLYDIWGDGILIKSASHCLVVGNTVKSPGQGAAAAGVSLGGDGATANDYNVVMGNTVIGASGSSLYIVNSSFSSIIGNTLYNGSGGGITLGGARDCTIVGNTIDTMALHGIAVATSGAGTTPERLTISENTISTVQGTTQHGIVLTNGGGHRVAGNRIDTVTGHGIQCTTNDCSIEGNYITGVTTVAYSGIRTTGTDLLISNNRIDTPKTYGIYHSAGARCRINENYISTSGARGIFVSSSVQGTLNGNLVRNSGQDAVTSEGILFDACTDYAVTGNRSYDDQGTKTQTYGIRSSGASDYLCVVGNVARGNSTSSITLVGANNTNASNVT